MLQLINKIIGDPNERQIRRLMPTVDMINQLEQDIAALSDDELRAKTEWFKNELANRPRDPQNSRADRKLEKDVLDMLLPEAFAVVREAAKRVLGMRHYDVQLIGGMVLHNGGIAEMRTGEGKTLVATLPSYLNALTGKGVHVVTVNDYLARRDAEWMGKLHEFLGLSVGVVLSGQYGPEAMAAKRLAYQADITYGTNNEFGFDYLRDNMATSKADLVQRPYNYAVIDEVDSILIDEARTPLIISGRLAQSADLYNSMAKVAPKLKEDEHYTIDEKARNIILTEEGIDEAQKLLKVDDLFDIQTNLAHHLLQALKAENLYQRDKEYVVKDDSVVIVDEFTGRMMDGRRWGDGLHQAVEAKEGVHIQDETQTLASITYQNLFRLYPKLSGMTGTALTEEAEFGKIYNLSVTAIPTNRPDQRADSDDVIYKTEEVKYFKALEDLIDMHAEGRPVLVGTASIEKSELISQLLSKPAAFVKHINKKAAFLAEHLSDDLKKEAAIAKLLKSPEAVPADDILELSQRKDIKADIGVYIRELAKTKRAIEAIQKGVPHQVLNAKHHEREAYIVAQAGRKGAITVATNMAGRGTDILLGGNPEFLVREELASKGQDYRELSEADFDILVAEKKAITDDEKAEVIELGGLHILGTERHESRRIDNQLRGRAARQGDPGSTRFYLSLEDNLMRIFGGQRVAGLMDLLKVDETLPIAAKMVSGVIETAQRRVEAYHFEIRKNVLKYDDVLTEQRQLIYEQRKQVLEGIRLRESMRSMVDAAMGQLVARHIPFEGDPLDWDAESVKDMVDQLHARIPQLSETITIEQVKEQANGLAVVELFQQAANTVYDDMEKALDDAASKLKDEHGIELIGLNDEVDDADTETNRGEMADHPLRRVEREILLSVIDKKWIEYLHSLDALREGIGLRAYGQKDPLLEYKREAFEMFQALSDQIQQEAVNLLFRSKIEIMVDQPMSV